VEPPAYAALLARLEKQGYSLQKLENTPQAGKK
jgi:apolipoprotein D and lipocalin family protein